MHREEQQLHLESGGNSNEGPLVPMRLLFEPKGREQSLVAPGAGPGEVHIAMLGRCTSGRAGVRAHLLGIVRGERALQMDDAAGNSS